VKTDFGYHVIEVIERDANRKLSDEQANDLRQRRLAEWLQSRRTKAAVVVNVADLVAAAPPN
jgi:parvulin-like peptidyl-prolyl isomerase